MVSVIRKRLVVSGRVQGVSFRAHARSAARKMGAKGWVRNCPDGTVEAVVEGETQIVNSVLAWFRKGSPFSRVDNIRITDENPSGEFDDFQIIFDRQEFGHGR